MSEAFLQDLIFEHPEMLPIREIEPIYADPIPLARELRTPSVPLDILLINPEGYLTLVETKLWRNPQARREVIGQIIDYAKHMAEWSFTDLEEKLRSLPQPILKPGQSLIEFFRDEDNFDFDERDFVTSVERNLRLGRFLLLIAGDGVEQMTSFINRTSQLGFQLALVEMPLFRLSPDDESSFSSHHASLRGQRKSRGRLWK